MRKHSETSLKPFLFELVIYAALVFVYFFSVLYFLNEWLKHLSDQNKKYYAVVALLLIVVQGIFFDAITTALFTIVRSKVK